jgi:hypothetical protein
MRSAWPFVQGVIRLGELVLDAVCKAGAIRAADLNDRSKWEEYASWLVERVAKLRGAFGPRVKDLNLSAAESARAAPLPPSLS